MFGHSSRGGGWKSQDPVLTLFIWYYRFLRRRIEKCPTAVKEAYELYVKSKFEEDGLDYATEMISYSSSDCLQTVQSPSETQQAPQQQLLAQPATLVNQPVAVLDSLHQNSSSECVTLNETSEEKRHTSCMSKANLRKMALTMPLR